MTERLRYKATPEVPMTELAMGSIGDHGALNTRMPEDLSEVWIDRDLGWLDFNQGFLAEALDEPTPLLERAKFLVILASNLNEFLMKRVSVLRQGTGEQPRALLEQLRAKLLEKNQNLFVPLYEVIRGNVHKLYGGMIVSDVSFLRITRDAEVQLDDDSSAGVRELVPEQIRQRRYEFIVRLEFGPGADPAIKLLLRDRFQRSLSDVYDTAEEVDYMTLFEIASLPIPELRDGCWIPLRHPSLPESGAALFAAIQTQAAPVHRPYDSFDGTAAGRPQDWTRPDPIPGGVIAHEHA